ncbi:MAG TPA: hypothetical protein VJ725_32065 [Thermoanaerobaculia bacterium]|nr:hypothetical protein [Thermoanaerobaculia bacterium]
MAQPASFRSMEGEKPKYRRLRVFAFDPGFGARLETLSISELTLEILWEDLEPGPIGEYIEVIDYDPASDAFYAPLDLNQPYLLAQAGLAPTSNSPQFHQQMVYAVAMNTINHFERALGRVALWNHRLVRNKSGSVIREEYVPRLRIYPHALREANAFYSPRKRALLFGYFPARSSGPGQAPGGTVFTSLSYDVVAHETTHALLDGLHPSFNEPTNPDMYALHEGFADIVALFQRFAHPKVLENEIARTRGHLELQNALGELAQQLGQALGMRGSLRDALGHRDESGAWKPHAPDPTALKSIQEPHERGAILLAAVFSAFLAIYKLRSADLLRIATNGTGVLPPGEIQPDLVRRLAQEAASAADAVLTMCIRGFDYCPPLDIDLGTYLRAVVTGDMEVYPQEKYNYRIAFIEAFRQWGIYPEGVRSMAENDLRYSQMSDEFGTNGRAGRKDLKELLGSLELDWDLAANRERVWETSQKNAKSIHSWLTKGLMRNHLSLLGLTLDPNAPPSVYRGSDCRTPALEVHSVRVARRRGFRDTPVTDLVVEVRQRRRGYFDPAVQEKVDQGNAEIDPTIREDFRFRRGCTLIIDPVRQQVRYAISTRKNVANNQELDRVRRFLKREAEEIENPFYRPSSTSDFGGEPFAALHRRTRATPDF